MLIVKTSSATLDPYCGIDRWREQLCGVQWPLLLLNANQQPPRSPEVVTPHLYLNSSMCKMLVMIRSRKDNLDIFLSRTRNRITLSKSVICG